MITIAVTRVDKLNYNYDNSVVNGSVFAATDLTIILTIYSRNRRQLFAITLSYFV